MESPLPMHLTSTPSSGSLVRSPEDEFHNEKTSPIRLRPLAARKKLFSEETGRKYEEAKNDDQVTDSARNNRYLFP